MRKLLGWERYDSDAALAAINALYTGDLRLLQNLFLPSVKLLRKERIGSRVRRCYSPPQTPIERLGAGQASGVDPQRLAELQRLRDTLDPFALSQSIQTKLDRLFPMASRPNGNRTTPSTASTTFHRLPQKEKSSKKERDNDDDDYIVPLPKKQNTKHHRLHSKIA